MKVAIQNKDVKKLVDIFSSTKIVRQEIIDAGQDTNERFWKKIIYNFLISA